MAVNTFRLPDPGEGLVEAEIISWRVAAGDEVKINDILLEVETSKSVVELPTPFAGTVTALLVNEGDTVEVGTPIVSIDDGVAASAAGDDGSAGQGGGVDEVAAEPTSAGEARVPNLVGYGPRNTETKRRPRKSVGADRGGTQVHDQLADSFSTGAAVSRRADHRQPLAHSVVTRPSETVAPPLPAPGPA